MGVVHILIRTGTARAWTRPSENYTSVYMSLNIKRHVYVSYTTYNLFKKIKRLIIFLYDI